MMMISNLLGTEPLSTYSRYNRTPMRYLDVLQPHISKKYNKSIGEVDSFDQNNNHLCIKIVGKSRYWSIVTRSWTM